MGAVQQKLPSQDRIQIAARELFATKGFHQTSMAELACAAEMSVGLIYRSFKSKDEIIEAIICVDFNEKLSGLNNLHRRFKDGELTILETFRELLLNAINEEHEAFSFDILAEGCRNEQVGIKIGNMCQSLRGYIREFARAANEQLEGDRLEGATELVLGCLFGLGHRNISMPNLCAERTADQGARMIVAALQAI